MVFFNEPHADFVWFLPGSSGEITISIYIYIYIYMCVYLYVYMISKYNSYIIYLSIYLAI